MDLAPRLWEAAGKFWTPLTGKKRLQMDTSLLLALGVPEPEVGGPSSRAADIIWAAGTGRSGGTLPSKVELFSESPQTSLPLDFFL